MTTVEKFVKRAKENTACTYVTPVLFARLLDGMSSLSALDSIPDTPGGHVIQDFGLGEVGKTITPQALEVWHACVKEDNGLMTVSDPRDGSVVYLGPAQYVLQSSNEPGDDRMRFGDWDD